MSETHPAPAVLETPEAPSTPEETLKEEEAPTQTIEPDNAAARLEEREAAVALRERRLLAREAMEEKSLPMELMKYFDYSSDAALENSLALASLVASAWPAPSPMPKQSVPPTPPFATYAERASVFATDPIAYRQLTSKPD